MKKFLSFFLLLNIYILAATTVKVGAYPFPPYLNIDNSKLSGKTFDLIDVLNRIQKKYKFELVVTSPGRRYMDLGTKFDLMFYEDLNWGWEGKDIENAELSLKDEEVFISLTDYYENTDFVKDIKTKKILLIRGFHYAFADFNTKEDYLNKNFKVVFTTSPQNTLDFLLNGRAQIAIITKSFLIEYLNKNPSKKSKILVNEKPDQLYNLTIIRSKKAPISIDELNNLVNLLKNSGKYKNLLGE